MTAEGERIVVVFGGTGFLGRRIVRHLRERAFSVRIASRHPERGQRIFEAEDAGIQLVKADAHDDQSVADALAGAFGAVNAVSLYIERGGESFHSVHVEAARRVALQAHRAGVARLVHVSGIGADPRSPSLYIRKRGEGEHAVRSAFPAAVVIRPAVMFGPDDAFLTALIRLLRILPIYPMFGSGETRLQPVYVEDIGEAIARIMQQDQNGVTTFECGGPRSYAYRELLQAIAHEAALKPRLMPVPFSVWRVFARASELFPRSPFTLNQVELMEIDTVPSSGMPGLGDLGVLPHSVEEICRQIVRKP